MPEAQFFTQNKPGPENSSQNQVFPCYATRVCGVDSKSTLFNSITTVLDPYTSLRTSILFHFPASWIGEYRGYYIVNLSAPFHVGAVLVRVTR